MKLINREQIAGMNIHYLFYSLDYFLDKQAELGFKTIELWGGAPHFYLDSMGYQDAKEVRKKIESRGLGYVAAVVSFGINSGAYVSEVIRGGIQAVDRGQTEAGRSLGLCYKDTMRYIVIPQAVKNILPAMGNEFIQLIKETSILGYVGIVDLTKAASYVSSRTYKMFIPLLAAGIVYYLIVKLLSVFLRKFERRLKESD